MGVHLNNYIKREQPQASHQDQDPLERGSSQDDVAGTTNSKIKRSFLVTPQMARTWCFRNSQGFHLKFARVPIYDKVPEKEDRFIAMITQRTLVFVVGRNIEFRKQHLGWQSMCKVRALSKASPERLLHCQYFVPQGGIFVADYTSNFCQRRCCTEQHIRSLLPIVNNINANS